MVKVTLQKIRTLLTTPPSPERERALVLSGGGARASYQAGALQYIAQVFPEASFKILTGVSAGAINVAHMASHTGTFRAAADHLVESWQEIRAEDVYKPEAALSLIRRVLGPSLDRRHPTDSVLKVKEGEALVDSSPLRAYLEGKLQHVSGDLLGVSDNLKNHRLTAACVTATNYLTGQTVTWVQGRDIARWQRPNRVSVETCLNIDHIMASTALPLLFPAVRIGNAWFGDGGIRLTAPLSPAIHLGADSILVISTRYNRTRSEADAPSVVGYPPAAQVIGLLMNAIFLDVLDQDALTMRRINALVQEIPPRKRQGFRPVKLLVLRPSQDLGKLASSYDLNVGGALRLLTRGLGTGETTSPDWLSMLLFDGDYLDRLVQIGWEDARQQHDDIARFLDPDVKVMVDQEPWG